MIKLAQIVPAQLNDYASCGCLEAQDLLTLGYRVVWVMITVIGTMFAIGIVYNAIRYFTAYGNEEQAGKAKQGMLNNLLAAVITLTVFVGFRAITVNRLFGLEGVVDTIYRNVQRSPDPPAAPGNTPGSQATSRNCTDVCRGRYNTPITPSNSAPPAAAPSSGTTPPPGSTGPINQT